MSGHPSSRPTEETRLFNPAFLALLGREFCEGYEAERDEAPMLPLLFIAVPVVLHRRTRVALPKMITSSMLAWLAEQPESRVGLHDRILAMCTYVREALLFACLQEILELDGLYITAADKPRGFAKLHRSSDEVSDCLKRAHFVGRWFARAGNPTTVMASWGVRP